MRIEALKEMLSSIEGIKDEVAKIFPDKIDSRYRYLFEEKVKTATAFFNSLLDIRKEISRSLKDEMDIRRRISGPIDDLEGLLDISRLAERVEKAQREKDRISSDQ